MRSNLLGLIEQCAQGLEARDTGGRAFALREVANHLEMVARDPSLWAEFANLYCLNPEDLDGKAAS